MSDLTLTKANPGPVGLYAYAMAVVMLCLTYVGAIPNDMGIFCMVLVVGGAGEFLAGMLSFKNNDTFSGTFFTAYGLFWWSLAVIYFSPIATFVPAADHMSLGFYLLLWGLFTLVMFLYSLRADIVTKLIFFTLTILFILLAISDFAQAPVLTTIAGWFGIISGALSFFAASKTILKK